MKKAKRTISLLLMATILTTSVLAYSDVPNTHWAYTYINDVTVNGFMHGTTSTTDSFSPDRDIQRCEVATALGQKFQSDVDSAADIWNHKINYIFSDCEDGAYYTDYVIWVVDRGFMNGVSSTLPAKFEPNRPITRQEVCVVFQNIIVTIEAFTSYKYNHSYSTSCCTDFNQVAGWATDAVGWMYANNILNGYPDGSFRPNNDITRAEFAKMLSMFWQKCGAGMTALFNRTN